MHTRNEGSQPGSASVPRRVVGPIAWMLFLPASLAVLAQQNERVAGLDGIWELNRGWTDHPDDDPSTYERADFQGFHPAGSAGGLGGARSGGRSETGLRTTHGFFGHVGHSCHRHRPVGRARQALRRSLQCGAHRLHGRAGASGRGRAAYQPGSFDRLVRGRHAGCRHHPHHGRLEHWAGRDRPTATSCTSSSVIERSRTGGCWNRR